MCQSSHRQTQCPYRSAKCHNCGKQRHLKKMCRQKQTDQPPNHSKEIKKKSTHTAAKPIDNVDSSTALYAVGDRTVKPFTVDVLLNGKPFSMELDLVLQSQ